MKKFLFVLFLASFSSLVAAASNDVIQKNGDPIKGQPTPQQTGFELSKGYFSLFDLLRAPSVSPKVDTSKSRVLNMPAVPKSGASKK